MPLCKDDARLSTLALGALVALTGSVMGQIPAESPAEQPGRLEAISEGKSSEPKARVVKMTLHPAAAPMPALKYHLLPEISDLKPGNAALVYQRAHTPDWAGHALSGREADKWGDWLEMPLRQMPRDKIVLLPNVLKEIDHAARQEYCDWQLTPRLRDEGYSLLINDVQGFRIYGHMLALRARLQMLDGHFDDAVFGLQSGFALSRHVGRGPTLINGLVSLAIGNMMFNQLEDFVQLDKAPNLYWALADLPRPFIDLRRPLQGEKVIVAGLFPEIRAALKNPNQAPINVQTINKYLDNLRYGNTNVSGTDLRIYFAMVAARSFPAAKQYLLGRGFSAQQIAAMPVTQVSLMYALALFDEAYDDMYKWQSSPAWQARPGMARARQKFDQMRMEQPEATFLAAYLMPALSDVISAKGRLERRPAMLQVVEALRLHAAAGGKLPERLADIHAVPVPLDPVTGTAFVYTLEKNRAILYAPPLPGDAPSERDAVRYELTLAQ